MLKSLKLQNFSSQTSKLGDIDRKTHLANQLPAKEVTLSSADLTAEIFIRSTKCSLECYHKCYRWIFLPPAYAVEVMFMSCLCVCVCVSIRAITFEAVDITSVLTWFDMSEVKVINEVKVKVIPRSRLFQSQIVSVRLSISKQEVGERHSC